jgi:hypothetical protein
MGVVLVNIEEARHVSGGVGFGMIVRFHRGDMAIALTMPERTVTAYVACLWAAVASVTAAEVACASLWGGAWTVLVADVRALLAEAAHLRAAGSVPYPQP